MLLVMVTTMGNFVFAAAEVPARQGVVTDTIGLFTSSEITSLDKVINQSKIKLNVLTAAKLTETEAEALASQAYKNWELSQNTVSVVISTNPNYVFAYYDNAELKKAVSVASTKDIKGIIDANFVPKAKSGKVADGVIELSKAFNMLKLTITPVVSHEEVKESQEVATSSSSEKPLMISLLVIVLAGGALVVIVLAVKRNRAIVQIKEASKEINALFSKLSELSGFVVMQDYTKGLVTGKTHTFLKLVDDEMDLIREVVLKTSDELKTYSVSWFGSVNAMQKAEIAKNVAQTSRGKINELKTKVQKVENSLLEIAKKIKESNEKVASFEGKVRKLQETTSYNLDSMTLRINDAKTFVAAADEADDFDLVEAQSKMDIAIDIIEELSTDIEKLHDQFVIFTNLPNAIASAKAKVNEIVASEGLLLADFDPYKEFPIANNRLDVVGQFLRSGRTIKAMGETEKINRILNEAVLNTQKLVDMRNTTQESVINIEKKIKTLTSQSNQVEVEIQKIAREFDQKHYIDLSTSFALIKEDIQNAIQTLPALKALNDPMVQQYIKAATQTKELINAVTSVEIMQQKLLGQYGELKLKQDKLQNQYKDAKQNYQQAMASLDHNNIRSTSNLESLSISINREMNQAARTLDLTPVDLEDIARQISTLQTSVGSYASHVEGILKEKQDAERRLHQLQTDYSSSRIRYGNKVNTSRYNSQYNSSISEIDRLITAGLFMQAMSKMNQAESYARDMQREHDSIIAEERRQADESLRSSSSSTSSGGSTWDYTSSSTDTSSSSDSGGSSW
ncbi:TPM domain-containing protein [Paenibacillus sp. FSL P4-0288]|uniref:TPM domain-containing protein n=1 Tax=Paenibacillus sp. FSL P4-0288 TaxID=2921633 RepID=UPI0030F82646